VDSQRMPRWLCHGSHHDWAFEVKTVIPSLGELIRQIKMYRAYDKSKFFVVSPDDRFVKVLNEQGIGFLKYPEGTIQL